MLGMGFFLYFLPSAYYMEGAVRDRAREGRGEVGEGGQLFSS